MFGQLLQIISPATIFCTLTLQCVKVESSKLYRSDQITQKTKLLNGSKHVLQANFSKGIRNTNPLG